jgi:hypothetical protein
MDELDIRPIKTVLQELYTLRLYQRLAQNLESVKDEEELEFIARLNKIRNND